MLSSIIFIVEIFSMLEFVNLTHKNRESKFSALFLVAGQIMTIRDLGGTKF